MVSYGDATETNVGDVGQKPRSSVLSSGSSSSDLRSQTSSADSEIGDEISQTHTPTDSVKTSGQDLDLKYDEIMSSTTSDGRAHVPPNVHQGGTCVSTGDVVAMETSVSKDNADTSSDKDNKSAKNARNAPLRGYLYKKGVLGLKAYNSYKKRYFVFSDNTCKLHYYRNSTDFVQLGDINIATAYFSFEAGRTDNQNLFEIRYVFRNVNPLVSGQLLFPNLAIVM